MTEVLLAFVVLSIMLGLLSGIIAFSKKMYVEATDLKRAHQVMRQYLYKSDFRGDYDGNLSHTWKNEVNTKVKRPSITQFLPVYKVEEKSDGSYDIALLPYDDYYTNRYYDGGSSASNKAGGSSPITGEYIERYGVTDARHISCITFAQGMSQVNVSEYMAYKEGLSSDEVAAKLGDLDGMGFLVFNQYDYRYSGNNWGWWND